MRIKKIENLQLSEHQEQVLFMANVALHYNRMPELMLMHANPNAAKRSFGGASYMKKEGLKSGIPDLHLPVPKGEFGGLWMELKRKKGGILSGDQKFWLNLLNDSGNLAVCCKGAAEADCVLWDYLNEGKQIERYVKVYSIKRDKIGKKGGLSRKYASIAEKKGWLV